MPSDAEAKKADPNYLMDELPSALPRAGQISVLAQYHEGDPSTTGRRVRIARGAKLRSLRSDCIAEQG